MPRTHGRIMSAIWTDPDFLALPVGPQRLYMFLLSQPDLSHAGLVPMRVRTAGPRRSQRQRPAASRTTSTTWRARFVVTDADTEELLVRTFVRNDGVYKQPKVMLRLREDARQIESPALRAAFRAELGRLPLEELSRNPTGRDAEGPSTFQSVSEVVDTLRADFSDAPEYPTEGVSDTPSDTPRVRAGAFPQPPTPVPQPPSPVPATPGGESPRALAVTEEGSSQALVAEWIDHCAAKPPRRVIGHVASEVKTMLDEGIAYDRVRHGLAEWNGRNLHPSTLPSIVHGIANRAPAKVRGQQATDDIFERAMERAVAREASQ
jgi:hypothetical protein